MRIRVLALFLPFAAVLLVVGEALTRRGSITRSRLLGRAQRCRSRKRTRTALFVQLACDLRAWGAWRLVRGDRRADSPARRDVATVAALVGGLAGFCGGLTNVLVGYDLAAAAVAHATRDAAVRFLFPRTGVGPSTLSSSDIWAAWCWRRCSRRLLFGEVALCLVGSLFSSSSVWRWLAQLPLGSSPSRCNYRLVLR